MLRYQFDVLTRISGEGESKDVEESSTMAVAEVDGVAFSTITRMGFVKLYCRLRRRQIDAFF